MKKRMLESRNRIKTAGDQKWQATVAPLVPPISNQAPQLAPVSPCCESDMSSHRQPAALQGRRWEGLWDTIQDDSGWTACSIGSLLAAHSLE